MRFVRAWVLNAAWLPSCITLVAMATEATTSTAAKTSRQRRPTGANTRP